MIGRSINDDYPLKMKSKDQPTTYYLKESFVITVHTAQCSEWDHVIMYAPKITDFFTRKLYYTAISRAKKKLTVLANHRFLHNVIQKEQNPRYENI